MTHNVDEETGIKSPEYCEAFSHNLPLGLVGPRCVSPVSVGDTVCESILDTGSQVTTISKPFHSRYLASSPIGPIHHLLDVQGAGGQSVLYLGYVEVSFTFPDSVTGVEEQLTALALVPECNVNSQIPVLVGTNVLLQLYQRGIAQDKQSFLRRSDGFALLLQHVAKMYEKDNKTHPVRLHGALHPITIPSRHKLCVLGDVRVKEANQHVSFVVEPPDSPTLPVGLFLECALVNINSRASSKVPVVLRNTTDRSITLPSKSVIGVVSAAQNVMSLNSSQAVSQM